MALVGEPFDATFNFSRARPAFARNEAGVLDAVEVDVPRFDHDADGVPRGLLIDAGPAMGQADRCRVVAGDWEIVGPATVLHEFADTQGVITRTAAYTQTVRATVDAKLAAAGHHRVIGAVPGHLYNRGGYVRYRERDWRLPSAIGAGDGTVVGDGSGTDRALIEG